MIDFENQSIGLCKALKSDLSNLAEDKKEIVKEFLGLHDDNCDDKFA
ncbi:hypothetical protein KVK77_04895 [Helicobacter pylori]|nr:hypothetical protein [Helicobacter pylori]WQV02635.1 hypothetical protein KVK74_01035 [Helicobacter pylori]WQV06308.1 hypothetical protein KVK77_04895 [Helicobacter pylori]